LIDQAMFIYDVLTVNFMIRKLLQVLVLLAATVELLIYYYTLLIHSAGCNSKSINGLSQTA